MMKRESKRTPGPNPSPPPPPLQGEGEQRLSFTPSPLRGGGWGEGSCPNVQRLRFIAAPCGGCGVESSRLVKGIIRTVTSRRPAKHVPSRGTPRRESEDER